jgi:hypothetical protein
VETPLQKKREQLIVRGCGLSGNIESPCLRRKDKGSIHHNTGMAIMNASIVLFVGLVLLFPHAAWSLETKTEKVGKLNVVTETEGPYVESGKEAFAMPSMETAVSVTEKNFIALRQFLTKHCAKTPGCELTYETETKAIIGAKSPTGQSFAVAYKEKTKKTASGTPKTIQTMLRGWAYDTYSLEAHTDAGNYCIPNDYAWKNYSDQASKLLSSLGEQEATLAIRVQLTFYPMAGETAADCKGFLGDITVAK